MNEEWEPSFQIELIDIINSLSIKKLHVGSSDSLIYETLGEPELPVAKLGRKSKIYNHLYGNVSILSENNTVININIDLHGLRKKMVILGSMNNWKYDDWLKLSQIKNWTVHNCCDLVQLAGRGIAVDILPDGKAKMLSLKTA